jgi:prephenate dehydrogenase
MTEPTRGVPPVFVLGLGLIGGSLLRAAAPVTVAAGWARGAETRRAARAEGHRIYETLDETIDRAAEQDGLLVLATPPSGYDSLLEAVSARSPHAKLTDIASIKGAVADQVAANCPNARYVGSHPMAGTQFSGWEAGSATLFDGAVWVTCLDEDSDLEVWADVTALALAIGSRVVPVDAAAHDDAVARVSHLPHLLALALAQVGAAGGALSLALAASSFADGTRVAGTRPELIRAMCEANGAALTGAMDEVLGILGVARASLASTGSLQKLTSGGHDARDAFEHRSEGLVGLTLSGGDMIDQLLAVGSAGGHVTAVSGWGPEIRVAVRYPIED